MPFAPHYAPQDRTRHRPSGLIPALSRRAGLGALLLALAACGSVEGGGEVGTFSFVDPSIGHAQSGAMPLHPGETAELRRLIDLYAAEYGLPVTLVHRVVQRESNYNPAARNGPYYGLMQILPQTARSMGYSGAPEGLLDAETNLRHAVRYLRGAWLVSGGSEPDAVKWYARGYYYEAKRLGLLDETGLRG